MTTAGANSRDGHWTPRVWPAVRELSSRTSLRSKLITALVALVVVALAAISVSGVWLLRSYLTSQDDNQLQAVFDQLNSNPMGSFEPGQTYQVHGTNILVGVEQPGTPLSPSSSPSGVPGWDGSRQAMSIPSVPTSLAWADAHNGKLVTVPAQSGNNIWRVITEPISYQVTTSTG